MQISTTICSGTHRIWWYEQVGKKLEMHVNVSFCLGSSISWHSMWRTCTPQATVFVSCVKCSVLHWLIDWLINQLLQLAISHMIRSYQLIQCSRPMSCFTAHMIWSYQSIQCHVLQPTLSWFYPTKVHGRMISASLVLEYIFFFFNFDLAALFHLSLDRPSLNIFYIIVP